LIVAVTLALRYLWYLDDAFVYFRYVDNLLFLKIGLVYNAGEYVDGMSSPLWSLVLIMTRATGLGFDVIIPVLAVTCVYLIWRILVALNWRLSPVPSLMNFPMVFLLLNYGVLSYFSSGLGTPLVLVSGAAYALLVSGSRSRSIQLLVALSPLLRHELIIPFGCVTAWLWWSERRFPFGLVATCGTSLGAWFALRIYYYADLLPTTFYLKDHASYSQGLIYLQETLTTYHVYWVYGVLLVAMVLLTRREAPTLLSQRLLMLALAAPIAFYVVRIGGDGRHFRYLAFPFCLSACALTGIPEAIWQSFCAERYRALVPAAGVALGLWVVVAYPPQLDRHPLREGVEHAPVDKIYDAEFHRQLIPKHYPGWIDTTPERLRQYRSEHDEFTYGVVRSERVCVLAYMQFYARNIHAYGLTDSILARANVKTGRPGHKPRLSALAEQIVRIHEQADEMGRGMYAEAVASGRAPRWIADNLEAIEIIERKIYNRHDLLENIQLAFTFPGKLKIRRGAASMRGNEGGDSGVD
jgi:hypothetical protein